MEIPTDRSPTKRFTFFTLIVAGCMGLLFLSKFLYASIYERIEPRPTLFSATVSSSDLVNKVSAYGKLRPRKVKTVVSMVPGTVLEITANIGDELKVADNILRLVNVELDSALEAEKLNLLDEHSNHKLLQSNLSLDEITYKQDIETNIVKLQLAKSELEARKLLFDKKVISKLEFEKSTLDKKLAEQALAFSKEKHQAFLNSKESRLDSSQHQLAKIKQAIENLNYQVEQLDVDANMHGTLYELLEDVQPGQSISKGQVIGKIADPNSLYAEVMVSASDAPHVSVGQRVLLSIKGESASGVVSSVSPNVVENQVRVDVYIENELPVTARTNINVNAEIIASQIESTLVSKRVSSVDFSHSKYSLYVKKLGMDAFYLTEVSIGELSNKEMQIVSGVGIGDQILLSVPDGSAGKDVINMDEFSG
jgi:multidrug efflux pump subunit AcrA (membrane-fusion protein)